MQNVHTRISFLVQTPSAAPSRANSFRSLLRSTPLPSTTFFFTLPPSIFYYYSCLYSRSSCQIRYFNMFPISANFPIRQSSIPPTLYLPKNQSQITVTHSGVIISHFHLSQSSTKLGLDLRLVLQVLPGLRGADQESVLGHATGGSELVGLPIVLLVFF